MLKELCGFIDLLIEVHMDSLDIIFLIKFVSTDRLTIKTTQSEFYGGDPNWILYAVV